MPDKKPICTPTEKELNKGWIWIMQIIFGVVATTAFSKLVITLPKAFESSFSSGLFYSYIALGAFVFVLYDLTAFHVLTQSYPYTKNPLSYFRFLLDVIMAFLMALIVFRLTEENNYNYTFLVGITFIAWHFLCICWHFLGELEYERPENKFESRAFHIHSFIIFLYILVLFGPCEILNKCFWDMELDGKKYVHFTLVFIAIVASIWRSYRIRERLSTGQ